jgi:hypothetical protein
LRSKQDQSSSQGDQNTEGQGLSKSEHKAASQAKKTARTEARHPERLERRRSLRDRPEKNGDSAQSPTKSDDKRYIRWQNSLSKNRAIQSILDAPDELIAKEYNKFGRRFVDKERNTPSDDLQPNDRSE